MAEVQNNNHVLAKDVTSYLREIFKQSTSHSDGRCYRGQADLSWDLKPSVMRGLPPDAENKIFSELMLEAPNEFSADKSMFDKLVRAQHYGLPTRLLDVSLNPLVSLYFACSEEKHYDKDGTVLIFDFASKRIKFSDSDTVSLICNLTRLSEKERQQISTAYRDVEEWNEGEKANFRQITAMKRLTQFVRIEKPYFLDLADPIDLYRYFFVYPTKNNRRVIAQSGAFMAAGLLQYRAPNRTLNIDQIVIPAVSAQQT
ncbi:FRG domain-containing protein, partial [Paraburkholderia caribensis]|uniref:FRG domain-containing protein n=1 Tax=Paraburkholderia caribensis TaxID=75105 RepID=UPI001CC5E30E